MDNNNRDFNAVAKVLLGLSMFAVTMAIITSFQKISLNSYIGRSNGALITEIIIDFLILAAAVLTFMKKRYGLIALSVLFVVRMFVTIPSGGDIAYSYQLGGKMAFFLRDFGFFAIAMCFKKDGVSGWRSMLFPTQSPCSAQPMVENGTQDVDNDSEIEFREIANTEGHQIVQDKEPLVNSKKEEELCINHCSTHISNIEQEKNITDSLDISDDASANLNAQRNTKQKHEVWNRFRYYFSRINKEKILRIGGPVIAGIAIVALVIAVLAGDYPKNINRFVDKFKYCFSLPNNRLAEEYFSKYQKASEGGLEELRKEYLTTAWDANPNDEEVLDSLSIAFFSLGHDSKTDNKYYDLAEEVCLKMLKKDPANKVALDRIARVYYNTEKLDKAYKIGEQLLIEDPQNGLGIDLMCRKSYYSQDWNNLLKWGKKGYELGKEQTSFWTELTYFYSKGLFETGNRFDAMKYYSEAEQEDDTSWLHKKFVKIGGIPCSISSVQIKNTTYDGKIIHKAGASIYDDNTRYLTPVIKLKAYRTGRFNFDVKIYANGVLSTSSSGKKGYTYSDDLYLWASDTEYTTELMGWGSDSPGHWKSGGYRIEIWWEGEKLYTYTFNIYSGFWHNLGYGNRLD